MANGRDLERCQREGCGHMRHEHDQYGCDYTVGRGGYFCGCTRFVPPEQPTGGEQVPEPHPGYNEKCVQCGNILGHAVGLGQPCTFCRTFRSGEQVGAPVEPTLLPCPFCGSDEAEVVCFQYDRGWPRVSCRHCFLNTRGFLTRADAIAAWNRRSPVGGAGAERTRLAVEELRAVDSLPFYAYGDNQAAVTMANAITKALTLLGAP